MLLLPERNESCSAFCQTSFSYCMNSVNLCQISEMDMKGINIKLIEDNVPFLVYQKDLSCFSGIA